MIYLVKVEDAEKEKYLNDLLLDNEITFTKVEADAVIADIVNNTTPSNDQMFVVRYLRGMFWK